MSARLLWPELAPDEGGQRVTHTHPWIELLLAILTIAVGALIGSVLLLFRLVEAVTA